MQEIKTVIVGYGLAGEVFHAPLIASTEGLVVAGVVTSNHERGERAKAAFRDAEVFLSFDDLSARFGRFDLAVIATPNKFHAAQAKACMEAGLAVVVDKPFATTSEDAASLIEVSRTTNSLLTVFQNRRWDGDFITLQRLIESGVMGKITRLESRFERFRPRSSPEKWRENADIDEGGGLLFDLMSHLIDQALVLFGSPQAVYAEMDSRRSGVQADDDTFVALSFAGGVRAHLWANVFSAIKGPRFRMMGTMGTFEKFGMDPQEDALRAGARPADSNWGADVEDNFGNLVVSDDDKIVPSTVETESGSYHRFYELLVSSIKTGSPPPVDPTDALTCLRIIEAARKSAQKECAIALEAN